MKEEIKVFVRKPVFLLSIMMIMIVMVFSYLSLPDPSSYNALYEKYKDHPDSYIVDSGSGQIETSDGSSYFFDQVNYINEIEDTISRRIDIIRGQMDSPLFQEDLDSLQKELHYEQEKQNAVITLENTYVDESLISSRSVIYVLYIIGILFVVAIFFDDIKNQNIHLYQTTDTHLSGMFIHKMISFMAMMLVFCCIPMIIEILLCKGNYSVYCISSLSDTFTDMTVKQYIIFKYLNCFVCTLLMGFLYLLFLLITGNHVISVIAFACIGFAEYIAYVFITETNSMMPLKYMNLMYWAFFDHGRYLSVHFASQILKVILILIFSAALFFIYTKQIHLKPFTGKKLSLRSTDPFAHVIYEVMIEAKGILAILVILLYSGYTIYNFQITKDSKEEFYQSFKMTYLGEISSEKYQKICEDYEKINEAYVQAQSIYQQANENPQEASQIYEANLDILELARNNENIARVKSEYEEAMGRNVKTFVDNRGANILFMKDQPVFFIQSMLVTAIPLITVCLYHHILIHQKERFLLINTSSLGLKVTEKINHICYFILILISTGLYLILHIYKVSRKYPICFTNTLRDLLIINIPVPVWLALILCELLLTCVICLIVKAGQKSPFFRHM